ARAALSPALLRRGDGLALPPPLRWRGSGVRPAIPLRPHPPRPRRERPPSRPGAVALRARRVPPRLREPGQRGGRPAVDPPVLPSGRAPRRVPRGRPADGESSALVPLPADRGGRKERSPLMTRDVVVAGGGPAGAALAVFLRRRGHDVLLLDAARF